MLVTFRTEAWSNISMFGDVAITLLKMAGHSGTVPGALRAPDVAEALQRLETALADGVIVEPPQPAPPADTDEPVPVRIALRAYPLLQLLAAAAAQERDVMWEASAPVA
jgi:hypothetical protein